MKLLQIRNSNTFLHFPLNKTLHREKKKKKWNCKWHFVCADAFECNFFKPNNRSTSKLDKNFPQGQLKGHVRNTDLEDTLVATVSTVSRYYNLNIIA